LSWIAYQFFLVAIFGTTWSECRSHHEESQAPESVRIVWVIRLSVVAIGALLVLLTRPWWVPAFGRALVCKSQLGPADALVIDNAETNYLLFERAADLQRQHVASRILVPTQVAPDTKQPDLVALGIVELMARIARLGQFEIVPTSESEPITLNVAYQLRRFVRNNDIRSVVLVTPALRSRRSYLVYESVLGSAGIDVQCAPVSRGNDTDGWNQSWHGVEQLVEQYGKLGYYRLYVLPFLVKPIDG
jgi:hypothetical protein